VERVTVSVEGAEPLYAELRLQTYPDGRWGKEWSLPLSLIESDREPDANEKLCGFSVGSPRETRNLLVAWFDQDALIETTLIKTARPS